MGGLVDVREAEHQHRSHRYREKSYRPSAVRGGGTARDPVTARECVSTMGRDHGEGPGQLRRRANSSKIDSGSSYGSRSPIEENSFTMEFRRSSSKRASGTPIRALINEELSREMEVRHPSPSVIARLMGLDTLPPSQIYLHKQQKETSGCFQKASSVRLSERCTSDVNHSLQTSTSEHQEFKDVFEVTESAKSEKHTNQTASKRMPCPNNNEKELDLRSQFMDAKRLSANERRQSCKNLNDALEDLHSNKDNFAKRPHDLKCSPPSPQPSHITILRPSKCTKSGGGSDVFRKSVKKAESSAHLPNDIGSFRKPMTTLASHSLKEHDSHSHKLLKAKYTGKADPCLHPTRIVVLKPNLEKAQGTARNVSLPRTTENSQLGFLRHGEFQLSGIRELHDEGRERHKLFDDSQVMRHKTKGSREIAREITERMRSRHIRDESSCIMPGMPCANNSEASQRTPDNSDDWNNNYHPSTFGSSESSVSREAKKRLSALWKMTHRLQDVGLSRRGSSTLGEMLAVSDTKTPSRTSDSSVTQKASVEKAGRHEALAIQGCPLGISSRDGCFTNLPRSTSLPAPSCVFPKPRSRHSDSSSDSSDNCDMLKDVLNFEPNDLLHGYSIRRCSPCRSFKRGSDKLQSFHSGGEENKLPAREIHVNMEETRNMIRANILADENKHVLSELSDNTNANVGYLVENSLRSECMDVNLACISREEQVQQPAKYVDSSASDWIDRSIEEASFVHLQEDILLSRRDIVESVSPVSSKEAEQPSPISVLDPPSEEESSSSRCFEKISADLQGLRMQLQLLKLESDDTFGDGRQMLVSDEETGREEAIEQALRDDDEDFSYILDVLISSGIKGADKDKLFSACYLPEYPVDPAVFEKLEKMHGELAVCPKSERKLLFDHINSILAEMLAPYIDLHPWVNSKRRLGLIWAPQGPAEEVSRIVVRQRKELCRGNPEDKVLDTKWLEIGDNVDVIGREIERMLKDELLEELVLEFILP